MFPCFEFDRILSSSLRSLSLFLMSADDRRSDLHSSDNPPFLRKDGSIQLFRLGPAVNGNNADGSVAFPSAVSRSVDSFITQVNLTENVDKFRSFSDPRKFATIHRAGKRLKLVALRYIGRHVSALGACKNGCLVLNRIDGSFSWIRRVVTRHAARSLFRGA